MIKRAKRIEAVQPFGIDRVAAAADAPPEARPDWPVLRLENLDTNLPLPPEAIGETAAALETPEANSWLPFEGDPDLRAAISDFTAARTGHRYDPETEIVITAGGMEGLLNALLATVDPGDEVLVTDPTYAGIVNRVRLAGGEPRFVPFEDVEGEWRLDTDALRSSLSDRTRAMCLMSPSMPSGGTFTEEDWRAVCDIVQERELVLIYDAAMERLLYDGRPLVHPLHFEGMTERTIVVGSLSKEHRMIGWRVGWTAAPRETATNLKWAHIYNTTMPVALSRRAATVVLRGEQGHVEECVRELERRRDVILKVLEGWPLVRPGGGWSLLMNVEKLGFGPQEASSILLGDAAVAATAMVGWGDAVAAKHIRFVYSAESVERLESLGERLAATRLAR
jgi:aspartate/methionine/tyrosine aminotransferase